MDSREGGDVETEVRLTRVRAQVAVIRTLADDVERLARVGDASGVADQLIEEMACLGCRLLEAAAALAGPAAPEESSVFERRPSANAFIPPLT